MLTEHSDPTPQANMNTNSIMTFLYNIIVEINPVDEEEKEENKEKLQN